MIYIGWDPRDAVAAEACASSIRRRSEKRIRFLKLDDVSMKFAYKREVEWKDGQRYDKKDGRPFSTDFSFSRFLVPFLNQYRGWALFTDPDILYTRSVDELFELADPQYAVMCVKHEHTPGYAVKMGGLKQEVYPRKNWSSVCLWNCNHPSNRVVTTGFVNTMPGAEMHRFCWLADHEIGALPVEWNWLADGLQPVPEGGPAAIHWTQGGPWFREYQDVPYADLFWAELRDYWWDGRAVSE